MMETMTTIPARPNTIEMAIRVRLSVISKSAGNGMTTSIISVLMLSPTAVQKTAVILVIPQVPSHVLDIGTH